MQARIVMYSIALFVWLLVSTLSLVSADESLVLYLTFDSNQGGAVTDLSEYGNHGVSKGKPELVDGIFESGYHLNGTGDTIEIPHHASLNMTDAFSLEMWVKLEAGGGADSEVGIEKGGWEAGEYSLYVHYVPGNGAAVQVMELPVSCGDANEAPLGPDLRDDTWHHLAGVWDGSDIFLYVDGSLAVSWECADGPLGKNGQPIYIGSRTASMRWLKGTVDEIRIYSRALSADEIKADMETLGGLAVSARGKLALSWAEVKNVR